MAKHIPENSVSKINLFLEQYRAKGLVPRVENQKGADKALQKKLDTIDGQKLGQDNKDSDRANDWFDVWLNVWANHAMENESKQEEVESPPKLGR